LGEDIGPQGAGSSVDAYLGTEGMSLYLWEDEPGEEVFGDLCGDWGGFAEYVCARENALALKPASMTFEEAAAIPQAAMLGIQGLRDKGQIQPGQKVLINGAGGGCRYFCNADCQTVRG
jgi:NADPH:quinone reductase-like Zn-dependent oxidoreductase